MSRASARARKDSGPDTHCHYPIASIEGALADEHTSDCQRTESDWRAIGDEFAVRRNGKPLYYYHEDWTGETEECS